VTGPVGLGGRWVVGKLLIVALLWSLMAFAKGETRIKVAVVDTGVKKSFPKEALCEDGLVNTSGSKDPYDVDGHGTAMACIVASELDFSKVCIWPIKYMQVGWASQSSFIVAFQTVLGSDAKYLNFSSVGYSYSPEEHRLVKEMVKHGITVVVAAGNERADLDAECLAFPACLNKDPVIKASGRLRVVGALNASYGRQPYSNYGAVLTDNVVLKKIKGCEFVQGTSPATAQVMNHILKLKGLGKK
jgi:subtilisin family serine protease